MQLLCTNLTGSVASISSCSREAGPLPSDLARVQQAQLVHSVQKSVQLQGRTQIRRSAHRRGTSLRSLSAKLSNSSDPGPGGVGSGDAAMQKGRLARDAMPSLNVMAYKRGSGVVPRASPGSGVATFDGFSAPSAGNQGSYINVYLAVAAACLAALLFGYHLGVVNGSLSYIAEELGFAGDAVTAGWVVSVTLAGATAGSFSGGLLADKLGRTRTFQINTIPLVLGSLLSATASGVEGMLIGRLLVGIGVGLSSAVVPLFISEVAPTEIRGALGTVNQLAICVGILAALVLGLPLGANPAWWRTMFWIAIPPALLMGLAMCYVQDSPRWLYKQGRFADAERAVVWLWGKTRAGAAMEDLQASAKADAEGGGAEEATWAELFSKRYRKVVIIGAAMYLFQQFAGINAVVYYSTAVFRKVGITSDVAASALVGAANVGGTAVASFLMDSQGRKRLLTLSFIGMAASMFTLAASLSLPALGGYAKLLAVAGTVTYVIAFSLGVGPVPALLLPEIFGSRIRAKAMSVSMATHWVTNFMIGLSFLGVVEAIGISGVYFVFGAVCVLGAIWVKRNIVETKGRSLEEIERMLSNPA